MRPRLIRHRSPSSCIWPAAVPKPGPILTAFPARCPRYRIKRRSPGPSDGPERDRRLPWPWHKSSLGHASFDLITGMAGGADREGGAACKC